MASNTAPNFTSSANFGTAILTAANTASDGSGTIGTTIFLALTAGANGTYVDRIEFVAASTAVNTAMTATVARVFLSDLSTGTTTSANTHLIGEVTLASTTAASSTAASTKVLLPVAFRVPAGKTLLVTTHAAPAANTAWHANPIGADY